MKLGYWQNLLSMQTLLFIVAGIGLFNANKKAFDRAEVYKKEPILFLFVQHVELNEFFTYQTYAKFNITEK
jgi:hypothetical protein